MDPAPLLGGEVSIMTNWTATYIYHRSSARNPHATLLRQSIDTLQENIYAVLEVCICTVYTIAYVLQPDNVMSRSSMIRFFPYLMLQIYGWVGD